MKLIVAALISLAVVTTARAADPAETYAKKCALCHGKAGEGAKPAPRPIAGMPAAKVKEAIEKGFELDGKKMKPVKIDDVDGVSAYVEKMPKK